MDPIAILAIFVISIAVSVAFAIIMKPKPPEVKPASLDQFSIPTVKTGKAVPVVFGTVLLTNAGITWYGDLGHSAVKSKSGAGSGRVADIDPTEETVAYLL